MYSKTTTMKLWSKGNDDSSEITQMVEKFTVGNDRTFDTMLAPYDVLGSIAHAKMLASVGLLTDVEAQQLVNELKKIYASIGQTGFTIDEGVEDIHSQVELMLTQRLGDVGKKIHSARSRNDQVLLDIKLFFRAEIEKIVEAVHQLFHLLNTRSEELKEHLLPGYTHLQLAMPSSFGLWLGAYAESLVDDTITLKAAYDVVNKNPLGSAAGYGSSFPINRKLTTALLGFADLNYNVVYAQMGRGKTERVVAAALANVADTLAKLSMDACLFMNQNFGFITFPAELTTGSSIMPHKKNPDVFELTRSHCNRIKALPNEIMMMTTNLPSGYHRDLQLLKENLFPAFETLKNCLRLLVVMLNNMQVKENILEAPQYHHLYSVEEVNKLVVQGVPFRDAYGQVAQSIRDNNFFPDKQLAHTHEGSIGNLCNKEIANMMDDAVAAFHFGQAHDAIARLLSTDTDE